MNCKGLIGKVIIITGVFCVAVICGGCGDGTYVAEKMYYNASYKWQLLEHRQEKESITDEEINAVIFKFKELILRYPHWAYIPEVYNNIANLYIFRKNYDAARKEYEALCSKFPNRGEVCAAALVKTAKTYEWQGRGEDAEKTYKRIMHDDEYVNTASGITIPLYLAHQYQKAGESEKVKKVYREGLKIYKKIIDADKNNPLLAEVIDFSLVCILGLDGPQEAIHFLKSLQEKYIDSDIEPIIMFNIAKIYQNNFKNKEETISYCQKIIDKYPQNIEYSSKALKSIAEVYEQGNSWEKAEKFYKRILNEYPYSSSGLIVPFYLAQHYKKSGQTEKAKSAFEEAFAFYTKVIEDKQKTVTSIGAVDFAAMSIFNIKGAEDTIFYLQGLKDRYPDSVIAARAVFNIARIYNVELKNKKEALKYYQEIVEKYPDIKLAEEVKKEIEKLSE